MRLSRFLMQDETFPISHAGWDFSDFSCRMRLFSFLIEDEIFTYSHSRWDFPNFSCRMRLFGFLMLHETFCPRYEKQKKNHFTKTASLRARGQKYEQIRICWKEKVRGVLDFYNPSFSTSQRLWIPRRYVIKFIILNSSFKPSSTYLGFGKM